MGQEIRFGDFVREVRINQQVVSYNDLTPQPQFDAEGREIAYDLVRSADIFVTNFHPSVLEDLKLAYDNLRTLNERLIYAHATGYGENGPDVEQPGYDMTAWWARSGLMDLIRSADNAPALSVAGMGDHPSAVSLFSAVMLALYNRERTGTGTKVSTSLIANGAWSKAK